jgi:ParB family chromosome partitioning protein
VDALVGGEAPEAIVELSARIASAGGRTLASYREPLAGRWLVLALLPVDRVDATPYQRELSPAHVRHLAEAMPRVGRYLDPIVAVPQEDGFWTPNGMHRLEAMRSLGARAITALVLPEHDVAMRILALNTERAHGLKDRSLEVARMARALAGAEPRRPEAAFADVFEAPELLTLGAAYERRPKLAGHAYLPLVRRCEAFLDVPIAQAVEARDRRADLVLALDDAVSACVDVLRRRGLRSPYLKGFVVARAMPPRERPARVGQRASRLAFEPTLRAVLDAVRRLDPAKVRPQDLAVPVGAPAPDA